jgi:serine/threonine-protein kinase SRPK3
LKVRVTTCFRDFSEDLVLYLYFISFNQSMCLAFRLRQQLRAASPLTRRIFSSIKAMGFASSTHQGTVYRWQDDVENLEAYRPGGYHPIKLGDEYCQGRYRIVHKLGYGAFSTVWLARDSAADIYVSLKVVTATASERSSESQVLEIIHQNNPLHPGRMFVSSLLNDFSIRGPNGNHRCLVTEILGPTVSDVKESFDCDLLSLDIARRVTAQLALGLADIHSCGIIHGGK